MPIDSWPLIGGPTLAPITRGSAQHVADGQEPAVDLIAPFAAPVYSIGAGSLIRSNWLSDCGLSIDLDIDGILVRYCHLSVVRPDIMVRSKPLPVSSGEWIGNVGLTGHTTGPHLHIAMFRGDARIEPEEFFGPLASHDVGKIIETINAPSNAAQSGAAAAQEVLRGPLDDIEIVAAKILVALVGFVFIGGALVLFSQQGIKRLRKSII